MPYLMDFAENQFATLETMPFNVLDATALSQIVMIHTEHVVPALFNRADFVDENSVLESDVDPNLDSVHFRDMLKREYFTEMFDGDWLGERKKILEYMAESPRYRDFTVGDYISLFDTKNEAQFAAMTFTYKNEFGVVAFRGTDGTLTGWKEDFNMGFKAPVPAQAQAVHYMKAVADRLPEKIYVVGHSKGGNLAEYAVTKIPTELQARIERVYNLDGPGFKVGVISDEEYAPIIDRIDKVVPANSMVGILMHSPVPMHVVPSNAQGFDAHNVFTWELNDSLTDFTYVDALSQQSQLLMATAQNWLAKYDDEQREQLVESLFQIIMSTGGTDMGGVIAGGINTVAQYLQGGQVKNEKDVANIVEAGRSFLDSAASIAIMNLAQKNAQQTQAAQQAQEADASQQTQQSQTAQQA